MQLTWTRLSQGFKNLPTLFGEDSGYRASWEKALICQQQVRCLGFFLTKGKRELAPERKKVITPLPQPQTKRGLREVLGATGFCRIPIPGFSVIVRPLCDLLGGPDREPPAWTEEARAALAEIKSALGRAPALGLPDIDRLTSSYVKKTK